MSERNGDKARFSRERERKILRRQRVRELRRALGLKTGTNTDSSEGEKQQRISVAAV